MTRESSRQIQTLKARAHERRNVMRGQFLAAIGAAVVTAIVIAGSTSVAGQGQAGNRGGGTGGTQKTAWGDPDLQGIWTNEDTATPMERPARFGNREFLTDEEILEQEKQMLARYERQVAAANPSGPRSTADLDR